jgi:hypothetical protein
MVKVNAPEPEGVRTPETYLGAARAQGFVGGPILPGDHDYAEVEPGKLPPNGLAYGGEWDVTNESATSGADASLSLNFGATRVFLVLGSPGEPRQMQVLLDGEPIRASDAGDDVECGSVTISKQRLYHLVDLPRAGRHVLTLRFEPGISGYAFTFG